MPSLSNLLVLGLVDVAGQATGQEDAHQREESYADCSAGHQADVGVQEVQHAIVASLKRIFPLSIFFLTINAGKILSLIQSNSKRTENRQFHCRPFMVPRFVPKFTERVPRYRFDRCCSTGIDLEAPCSRTKESLSVDICGANRRSHDCRSNATAIIR